MSRIRMAMVSTLYTRPRLRQPYTWSTSLGIRPHVIMVVAASQIARDLILSWTNGEIRHPETLCLYVFLQDKSPQRSWAPLCDRSVKTHLNPSCRIWSTRSTLTTTAPLTSQVRFLPPNTAPEITNWRCERVPHNDGKKDEGYRLWGGNQRSIQG